MKSTRLLITSVALFIPLLLAAQTTTAPAIPSVSYPSGNGTSHAPQLSATAHTTAAKKKHEEIKPFSHVAVSAGVGINGVNLQVATNVNRYFNVRGIGNVIDTSINNISSNEMNANAKINFSTGGVALDFYPFPHHGLRISPGFLFANNNQATFDITAQPGATFTMGGHDFTSSNTDPVSGYGSMAFNKNKQAFTISTGWGNMIPRTGGHFSFPVELGVAFVGQPQINLAINKGQVCTVVQGHPFCDDVTTDPTLQSAVIEQVAKFKNDFNDVQFFPIVSFGVAYSFKIR